MDIRKGYKYIKLDKVENKRYKITKDGSIIDTKRKVKLKGYWSGNGYLYVSLVNKYTNKDFGISLHRLMALTFIPKTTSDEIHNRKYVHFKDFNHSNITLDNMEWLNKVELQAKTDIFYNNPKSNRDYAPYICRMLEKGYDEEEICDLLNLSKSRFMSVIDRIYKKRLYKEISKKYRF